MRITAGCAVVSRPMPSSGSGFHDIEGKVFEIACAGSPDSLVSLDYGDRRMAPRLVADTTSTAREFTPVGAFRPKTVFTTVHRPIVRQHCSTVYHEGRFCRKDV